MADRTYLEVLNHGPFLDHPDPWAESGEYFQQLHTGLIGEIFAQIANPLLEQGYITKMAEPGIMIEIDEPELRAIHIFTQGENRLITVVEIISPRNKDHPADVVAYQERRQHLFLDRGINVAEIDLTRSNKRLIDHPQIRQNAYHIVIFIPSEGIRVIGMTYGEMLKRFALPLQDDVIGVDLQQAYTTAYQKYIIAAQLDNDGQYAADNLPYPTLLTDLQRQEAVAKAREWQQLVASLRPGR